MKQFKGILQRGEGNDKQTIGTLKIKYKGETVLSCNTLELPEKENKKEISRIPEGTYKITPRSSRKFGSHLLVNRVKGRSYILLHKGNFYKNTKGCILVGKGFADINNDGYTDVLNSFDTLKKIVDLVNGHSFVLVIKNKEV